MAQLALAGASLAGIEIVLLASDVSHGLPWQALLFPVVACVYLAAGVTAWLRRPSNRTGALLTAGGFSWLAAGLTNVSVTELVPVGLITATLGLAVIVHVLHAFPSGRLRGRLSLWTVVAGYLVCIVLQAPSYLFASGQLELSEQPVLVRVGSWAQVGAGTLVMLLTVFVLGGRLARMAQSQRRVLGQLYVFAIAAVLCVPATGNFHQFLPWNGLVWLQIQLAAIALVPVLFVLSMLLGGFARTGELEELGAWLGDDAASRSTLSDALRGTLGDPSLVLAFWIADPGGYVDSAGQPQELPERGGERGVVKVALAGERVGAIVYDATLISDPELIRTAGSVVSLALERERLPAALRASTERLRASRARVVRAADDERRRIARDLHDGLQTRLILLAIKAHAVPDGGELRAGLETAITEVRELVQGVMPAALTERGLYAALEELADAMPIPTRLELDEERAPLPAPTESAGYYLVSEALSNAVKHSHARELVLRVVRGDGRLTIEVADDGVGGARAGSGAGLRSMMERVEALDGRLRVDSPAGGGTRLVAEVPCAS